MQTFSNSRIQFGDIAEQLHGLSPDQRLAAAVMRTANCEGDTDWFDGIDDDGGVEFYAACEALNMRPPWCGQQSATN